MALKSYHVVDRDGDPVFHVIVPTFFSLKELNELFQKGMKVTVIDKPSQLVNKEFVDK